MKLFLEIQAFIAKAPKNLKEFHHAKRKAKLGNSNAENITNQLAKLRFDFKDHVLKHCLESEFPLYKNLFILSQPFRGYSSIR